MWVQLCRSKQRQAQGLCCAVHGAKVHGARDQLATVPGCCTLEGLPALYAQQRKLPKAPDLHPLQQAFIDEQALHCGYCYNGQTIKGAELLSRTTSPTEAQIRDHMNGHLCRCGTYPRIMKSIQAAAAKMSKEG